MNTEKKNVKEFASGKRGEPMDKDFVITPEQIKNTSQEESPHFVTPMRNEIFNNGTPEVNLHTPTQHGIDQDR